MAIFKVKYDKNGKPVKAWELLPDGKYKLLPHVSPEEAAAARKVWDGK